MENVEEKKYWIWLSLIKNLGTKKIKKLLETYKTPQKIYQLSKEELLKVPRNWGGYSNKYIELKYKKRSGKTHRIYAKK